MFCRPLENSLLTDISNVCLIVADLIRGRKVNHEVTLNYYKKLLQKRGVLDVQKVNFLINIIILILILSLKYTSLLISYKVE